MEVTMGWVSGRVQGVGFRYFVRQKAEAVGVDGYAKNLSDGRVEVLLCGPQSRVAQLQQAVQSGPAGSHVEAVEWQESSQTAPLGVFQVL